MSWPGDREGTVGLESSYHLPFCHPHTVEASQSLFLLNAERQARKLLINFYSLWFDQIRNQIQVYRFISRRSIHLTTDRLKKLFLHFETQVHFQLKLFTFFLDKYFRLHLLGPIED